MMTHIAALVSAIVLTEWLIVAGWMSGSSSFYYWAGAVVLVWWLATRRNNPAWPAVGSQLRPLITFVYFTITVVFALIANHWLAYLVAGTILALGVMDAMAMFNRNREEEEEERDR